MAALPGAAPVVSRSASGPRVDRGEAGGPEPERAGRRPHSIPIRVLVADDEDAIRLLCRVNLRLAGMEVLEAADGAAAIELARRERPDLVLLDVMMPDVDGWEVAAALAADASTREIPIVFLTARSERSDQRRGLEAGAVAYVTKPFDPIALAPFLERLLERVARGERERVRAEQLEELSAE